MARPRQRSRLATPSITVNYPCTNAAGYVTVLRLGSGCNGTASSQAVTNIFVDSAGPISGSTSVPPGQNGVSYSIFSVGGATGYNWTLPSGAISPAVRARHHFR